MPQPSATSLVTRATALDRHIERGAPIWYLQTVHGGYGRCHVVPGVFARYGNLRVAVVLTDAAGGEHSVYVSPANVYPRLPGEDDENPNKAARDSAEA